MSSCFLCDTSYAFTNNDNYSIVYSEGNSEKHYMKYMPVMVGSSGTNVNDQQHNNNNNQNYVSYRVKKIEFRASVHYYLDDNKSDFYYIPDYIIIFKVPFREIIFDYYFTLMKDFVLFSEPESVLKYGVYSSPVIRSGSVIRRQKKPDKFDLIVDKPFIVGPNDYVGVLYMFYRHCNVDSSAKVWFDVL